MTISTVPTSRHPISDDAPHVHHDVQASGRGGMGMESGVDRAARPVQGCAAPLCLAPLASWLQHATRHPITALWPHHDGLDMVRTMLFWLCPPDKGGARCDSEA